VEIVSLIPSFELGLWNAWILLAPYILGCYLRDIYIGFLRKRESSIKEGSASRSYVRLERIYVQLLIVIGGILLLYSVFLPLAIGTVWFYAGLAVYLTGWTLMVLATLVFIATPADKPNTTGIYSISRHPIYLGWFSVFISMGIASASWVYILLASVSLAPIRNALMIPEERKCCERFGNAYKEYMNKTPRWLGIPKSEKGENT
jgi:protein-S-isoprenylcysteine O-methyltransferase Ste14